MKFLQIRSHCRRVRSLLRDRCIGIERSVSMIRFICCAPKRVFFRAQKMKIKKQFSEAVQLVKKSAAAAADAGAKFDDTLTSIHCLQLIHCFDTLVLKSIHCYWYNDTLILILERWLLIRYIGADTTIRLYWYRHVDSFRWYIVIDIDWC